MEQEKVQLQRMVAELVADRDALAVKIARMYEQKPVDIKAPSYDHHAMGCGLKIRNITDCHEAMGYGWDCAIELMFDQIGGPLYARPVPAAQHDGPTKVERLDMAAAPQPSSNED